MELHLNNTKVWSKGDDVTQILGILKYDPPTPQDLNASGPFGFGIPKTDEERVQSLDVVPFGESVDVTLKIDGQSWSAFCKVERGGLEVFRGVGGRSFLYKLDRDNNYTRNEQRWDVLNKLEIYCHTHNVSLCIRGESYGHGIQKGGHNPHAQLPLNLAFYSTWLIDERRYARKGDPFYLFDIAEAMGLPTVPVLQRNVILTPELIHHYAEETETVDGRPFEGVVIQHAQGSFKVISLHYDSKK